MTRIGSLHEQLGDRWASALLGGGASIPVTTVSYWQSGSTLSLSPVLLGGLLAGYLATRQTGTSDGVGVRAGLVGGLPVVWVLFDIASAASALSGPAWFVGAGLVLTVSALSVTTVVALGLSALAGTIGGRIGGWLAGQTGGQRPSMAGR